VITTDSFPTPALALRSADPAELARVRAFADHQAQAAEALRRRLAEQLPTATLTERVALLERAFTDLIQWRYQLARRSPGRIGIGIPLDADRFRRTIRDAGPNFDRLGDLGRLRAGAHWDPATKTYQGGQPTPASKIMAHYGQTARDRFAAEGPDSEVLQNEVLLPGGRLVKGNRLVRGAAAARIADALVARVRARGQDVSRMEVGGELLFAITADTADADVLHAAALSRLAYAFELDRRDRIQNWQTARYLLYQSPRTKKGSDAVTRVFLVAVGAVLFDQAPTMQQDADLRCIVLGQFAATRMPADQMLYPA
jgi:hypothetical protein